MGIRCNESSERTDFGPLLLYFRVWASPPAALFFVHSSQEGLPIDILLLLCQNYVHGVGLIVRREPGVAAQRRFRSITLLVM